MRLTGTLQIFVLFLSFASPAVANAELTPAICARPLTEAAEAPLQEVAKALGYELHFGKFGKSLDSRQSRDLRAIRSQRSSFLRTAMLRSRLLEMRRAAEHTWMALASVEGLSERFTPSKKDIAKATVAIVCNGNCSAKKRKSLYKYLKDLEPQLISQLESRGMYQRTAEQAAEDLSASAEWLKAILNYSFSTRERGYGVYKAEWVRLFSKDPLISLFSFSNRADSFKWAPDFASYKELVKNEKQTLLNLSKDISTRELQKSLFEILTRQRSLWMAHNQKTRVLEESSERGSELNRAIIDTYYNTPHLFSQAIIETSEIESMDICAVTKFLEHAIYDLSDAETERSQLTYWAAPSLGAMIFMPYLGLGRTPGITQAGIWGLMALTLYDVKGRAANISNYQNHQKRILGRGEFLEDFSSLRFLELQESIDHESEVISVLLSLEAAGLLGGVAMRAMSKTRLMKMGQDQLIQYLISKAQYGLRSLRNRKSAHSYKLLFRRVALDDIARKMEWEFPDIFDKHRALLRVGPETDRVDAGLRTLLETYPRAEVVKILIKHPSLPPSDSHFHAEVVTEMLEFIYATSQSSFSYQVNNFEAFLNVVTILTQERL